MHKQRSNEYTCVLTSCNRFDLLEKTLRSFFKNVDIQPKEFIIIEDSGNKKVHDVLSYLIILSKLRLIQRT